MTLDFERADHEGSRFFSGGHIPEPGENLDVFVRMVEKLTQDEMAIFSDEIKDFSPEQVEKFCKNVVPSLKTEPSLAAIFHSHEVVAKMTMPVITQAFSRLYEKKYDCYIRKEFFEEGLRCLVTNVHGTLRIFKDFMGMHRSIGDRPEWFQSNSVDQCLALQVAVQSEAGLPDYRVSLDQWRSICRFELPETLGAFFRAKIVGGEAADLIELIGQMTQDNLLSDKYIQVIREITGDDFFLRSCKKGLGKGFGLFSALQLVPIYGEAALHNPEFLSGLKWGQNTEVPEYIKKFSEVHFNENKLPLLAQYTLSKMNHVLKKAPDGIRSIELEVRFCCLADRLGQGEQALRRLAQILVPPGSDLRRPSRIFEAVMFNQSSPVSSMREEGAYKLMAKVISKLGLETLHKVAPDVSGRFLVDMVEGMSTYLTTKELIRLFPQAKGDLLENDLGL